MKVSPHLLYEIPQCSLKVSLPFIRCIKFSFLTHWNIQKCFWFSPSFVSFFLRENVLFYFLVDAPSSVKYVYDDARFVFRLPSSGVCAPFASGVYVFRVESAQWLMVFRQWVSEERDNKLANRCAFKWICPAAQHRLRHTISISH